MGSASFINDLDGGLARAQDQAGKRSGIGICGEERRDCGAVARDEGEIFFHGTIFPARLDGQPGEDLQGCIPVGWMISHLHSLNAGQDFLRRRIIKETSNADAKLQRTRPGMILDDEATIHLRVFFYSAE